MNGLLPTRRNIPFRMWMTLNCNHLAPVQPIHQPQPSPYHRPWEVQQSTPLPQTSYTTQDMPPMRHETASYHQGTKLPSSMLQPTYGLRQQRAYSTAPIIRPPQHIPIMTRGSSLSLNQETVYQHLPNPAEESTIDPPGDSNMLDILGKMMGELQIMKYQILSATPIRPQMNPAQLGEFNYPSSDHLQHPEETSFTQPPSGYCPDTPVHRQNMRTMRLHMQSIGPK